MAITPDGERLVAALVIALAYLVFCAWIFRQQRRQNRRAMAKTVSTADDSAAPPILVAFASQTGFAEYIAEQTAAALEAAGRPVRLIALGDLDAKELAQVEQALFLVSTTGEGDAPDSAMKFLRRTMRATVPLPSLRYGFLAFGDQAYEHYCGFGRELDTWLSALGATRLFDTIDVDDANEHALARWRFQVSLLCNNGVTLDWTAPALSDWTLAERTLLNADSPGAGAYHIALTPPAGVVPVWAAGDIAAIQPQSVNGDAGADVAPRDYSIGSLPTDGRIELLVRRMTHPDGTLGLGSGWLTQHAEIGASVPLRLRENRNFHGPADNRPLILIANGTGIAGLRAHIKARAARGQNRNWLLFGERTRAHDFHYRSEIESWRDNHVLQRLDLAFSRDQAERVYVQDLLRASPSAIARWIEDGAAINVCGSADGMAGGVDAALADILGRAALDQLGEAGRYRRDVY